MLAGVWDLGFYGLEFSILAFGVQDLRALGFVLLQSGLGHASWSNWGDPQGFSKLLATS